jgi:hypothetical protein
MVIANTFILWLLGGAAFIAVAAVVQKRSAPRAAERERSSNLAS